MSNLVYAVGALSHILEADTGRELFDLYTQVLSLAVPEDEGIEMAGDSSKRSLGPELLRLGMRGRIS